MLCDILWYSDPKQDDSYLSKIFKQKCKNSLREDKPTAEAVAELNVVVEANRGKNC